MVPGPPEFFDVRMRGFKDRMDVVDVLDVIRDRVDALTSEPVPIGEACGRVLVSDVEASADIPPFRRAAMDGYAVRAGDTSGASAYSPVDLTLIGQVLPGTVFGKDVGPGQAVRIMTGAAVPAGADAVVKAEAANEKSDKVEIVESVQTHKHIADPGEDVKAGACVVPAGRLLRPQDVAMISAFGVDAVDCIKQPTVRIIPTGDELVAPGTVPQGAQIVNTNSIMLRPLIATDGGVPVQNEIVRDGRELIEAAIDNATEDVLILTGGTSVGTEDYAPRIVAERGELAVHGITMRPSSPTGIGFVGEQIVVLLPGNPVSALCAYEFFAGPIIRRRGGRPMEWPHATRQLPLARKISSAVGRTDYVRVKIVNDQVDPVAIGSASNLSNVVNADGAVIVPRDSEGYPTGKIVTVYLYR